jgi:hypothetical protein
MIISKEYLIARRDALLAQKRDAEALLLSVSGALQENDFLLKEADKQAVPEPDQKEKSTKK